MNKHTFIAGAALWSAAGLWIGGVFAATGEAQTGRSTCPVNIWPQPAEMGRSTDYAVSVDGRPIDVLQTRVTQMYLPPGHVTNLVFRNVAVGSTARPAVYVESHDTRHTIKDFRFENVTGCDKASVRFDMSGEAKI